MLLPMDKKSYFKALIMRKKYLLIWLQKSQMLLHLMYWQLWSKFIHQIMLKNLLKMYKNSLKLFNNFDKNLFIKLLMISKQYLTYLNKKCHKWMKFKLLKRFTSSILDLKSKLNKKKLKILKRIKKLSMIKIHRLTDMFNKIQ